MWQWKSAFWNKTWCIYCGHVISEIPITWHYYFLSLTAHFTLYYTSTLQQTTNNKSRYLINKPEEQRIAVNIQFIQLFRNTGLSRMNSSLLFARKQSDLQSRLVLTVPKEFSWTTWRKATWEVITRETEEVKKDCIEIYHSFIAMTLYFIALYKIWRIFLFMQ